ncbi:DNA-3-methyladenine glycosylase [Nonomuraea recticatena]|uniref:DNA-3-methyladenine glycosylase n=1 Tax=Nonomuraea recticatena TaxID=46178 RepID=UPI00361975E1
MGLGLLSRDFFDRPAHEVAPELLGRVLVHGEVSVRLTEVEAYGLPGRTPPLTPTEDRPRATR